VNRIAYALKLPFTNLILKNIHDPKRGSIVVFESPIKPGLVLVKRLIAIPGDEVEIKNGFVFLNGKATAEPLPDQIDYHEVIGMHDHLVQRIPELYHPDYFHFRVPEGHFFMMGDNRDNSADGRVFGFVSRDLLIGEATRVIFSMNIDQPLNKIVAWQRFLKALI
jgi:signal peptidase I